MEFLQGRTADEAWRKATDRVMAAAAEGDLQASRAGETVEILHVAFEIKDPRQRWVVSRVPCINPAFAIAEFLWVLSGSNDSSVPNYWFPGLSAFQGAGPTYDGAYGYRFRHQFGLDQICRACDSLAANPTSRQVVLQIWDPRSDLPHADGAPRSQDIPCNISSLLKIRHGRLEWTQIMRSTDIHRGLPYDFLQFTTLQEVLAGWLGVDVGTYHHWSDSLHAYSEAMSQFSCAPDSHLAENTDSLAINRRLGESLIGELYHRSQSLAEADLSEVQLAELVDLHEAPLAYQNLLSILGAESARKRGHRKLAAAIARRCSNPQLVQAWSAWWARTNSRP